MSRPPRLRVPHVSLLRRGISAIFVCLLAVTMLGANASMDPSARFGRIGHNLMCVCSCGQVLVECNHVGCPDSKRMIGELKDQIGDGTAGTGLAADSQILNWFAAKYGATVLAAPIRGGFDNVAWIIPIALFLFATLGTAYMVRLWTARRPAMAGGATMSGPVIDDSLRERIRRETEFL